MKQKDNFSTQAALYAKYRPDYPLELYQFISQQLTEKKLAWDVGTGNGQVATILSDHFEKVYATDISQKQLDHATQKPNVEYHLHDASNSNLPNQSVDLITVAQALHWFDFDSFYQEVHRVAKPNAHLAIWSYGLLQIEPTIDHIVLDFYQNIVGRFWDKERRHIENNYAKIPLPFTRLETPGFYMKKSWNLAEFTGYLNTWSAVQHFIQEKGINPISMIENRLEKVWPDPDFKKEIVWKLNFIWLKV